MGEALNLAARSIDRGAARAVLDNLIEFTNDDRSR
jgi:hypothetical protein